MAGWAGWLGWLIRAYLRSKQGIFTLLFQPLCQPDPDQTLNQASYLTIPNSQVTGLVKGLVWVRLAEWLK